MKYDFSTNEYVLNRVDGSEYRWDDLFPGIVQNFWTNDPTVWDLENKVTWDELAPSLQELIIRKIRFSDLHESLQNRIIDDENNIAANTNAINNEIATRRAQDKIIQDQVDSLKRRMSAAEKRITDLEERMDEAERQITLLWEQVRLLWAYAAENRRRIEYLEGKLLDTEDELGGLTTKVTNINSINFPGVITGHLGTPSDTYYRIPEDSWVQIYGSLKGHCQIWLEERDGTALPKETFVVYWQNGEYSSGCTCFLPMKKGDLLHARGRGYAATWTVNCYPFT